MAGDRPLTDAVLTQQFECDSPWLWAPGRPPNVRAVEWNETEAVEVHARLWPHNRLMTRLTSQLKRLPAHRILPRARTQQQRLAFRSPASASSATTAETAALGIHRSFRWLEAIDYWLHIEIKASDDGSRRVTVQPRLSSKSVAAQLRVLAEAIESGDLLEWERAWRSVTPRAMVVLDAALEEAKRRRSNALRLHHDDWIAGTIISSRIPTQRLVAAVLPDAQMIASKMRRPSLDAEYETLQALLAWFHVLTGRRCDTLPMGDPNYPRGNGVTYVRWLERCFRRLVVKRCSFSAWRRALRSRQGQE